MKRLFRSSKFWTSVVGCVAGCLVWKFTDGSVTITSLAIGLFSVGSIGTAIEDTFNRSGGELPPDDDKKQR